MTNFREQYKVADTVPEGRSGAWRIERVTVTLDEAKTRNTVHPSRRPVEPGTFSVLWRGNVLVMIDSFCEVRDHRGLFAKATGHVLLCGLGLGMAARALLLGLGGDGVERVTVVERSPDVLALVAPHLRERFGERFEAIEGDAYSWPIPRGARWGAIWHDVWDAPDRENYPEMKALRRRFRGRAPWQGCWCEHESRYGLG